MRTKAVLAGAAAVAMAGALAGCSTTASGDPSGAGDDGFRIAVLVGGADNAYQAAGVEGIKAAGKELGVDIIVFDGTFDPAKQYGQFQTVVSSGTYDAILINPVDTSGIVPLVADAVAAGMLVGTWNQPLGTDLSDPAPTVDGVTVQVMTPPARGGVVGGQLTVDACEEIGADPCKVALLNFQKGSTFDTAVDEAFFEAIAGAPNVQVVTQVDSGATREGGLAAVQTILSGIPDVNVIIGASQSITGALQAVEAAGARGVYFIAQGLTQTGAQEIRDGLVWAGTYNLPIDEGRLALQQIVLALKGEAHESGIDPTILSDCADGVISANVDLCEFQFNG